MRIELLDLLRYGCFTDLQLDLSAPGLHVVVGPNEAGKSTARAAVADLLFGFPQRSPQAHIHASADLCIAAHLSHEEGDLWVRRAKRRPQLRDGDGNALDEDVLAALVGGIDRNLFTSLFAIGHEELRAGADQLLQTHGDVGKALFGAATGRSGAASLLDRLHNEAAELFKPRSPKSAVMAAIAEHGAASATLDAVALPPAVWSRAAEELAAVDVEVRELSQRKREVENALARLTVVRSTRPHLLRIERARRDLAALAAPRIGSATRARTADLTEELTTAARSLAAAEAELALLEAETRPEVDHEILRFETTINALHQELGSYRSAVEDLPRHEARVAVAKSAVATAAGACGRDPASAPAVPSSARAELLVLARELEELTRSAQVAREREREADAEHARSVAALAAVSEPPDASQLVALSNALPTLLSQREDLTKRAGALRTERDANARAARELCEAAALPGAGEIDAARRERDAAWDAVRSAWARGDAFDDAVARAAGDAAAEADRIADRYRSAAAEAGRLQAIDALVRRADAELDALDDALAAVEARLTAITDAISEQLSICGVAVPPGRDPEVLAGAATGAAASIAGAQADRKVLVAAAATAAEQHRIRLAALAAAEASLAEVGERWDSACAAASLGTGATPVAARAHLEALASYERAILDLAEAEAELGVARTRVEQYSRAVEAAAASVGGTFAGAPDEVAETLAIRLREAVSARATGAALDAQRAATAASLDRAVARVDSLNGELAAIASEAGVSSVSDLHEACERSLEAEALEDAVAGLVALMEEASQGRSLEELEALAAEAPADPAQLDSSIDALDGEAHRIDARFGELQRRRGELSTTLAQWRGADEAAVAAERMAATAASAGELAERYVRLRLAHEILRREIERNREDNHGPVLRRASEHLATLTNRRFVEVLDGGEDAATLGIRRFDRELLGIESLSEGTRDQLWLALRLAALERWSDQHVALPLVLDDICMTFDDERTAAALQLLAGFTSRFQVLFFTHHESVAALATRVLKNGEVHVHRLERFVPANAADTAAPKRLRQRKASPPAA